MSPGGPSYEQHRQQGRRDEHPEKSRVEVRIDVASVNTGNAERDQHLRTADFFDTDTHPEMTFRSTSVRMTGKAQLIASGPLTIKGISREIDLPLSLLGTKAIPAQMQPMLGGAKQVASFRAGTTSRSAPAVVRRRSSSEARWTSTSCWKCTTASHHGRQGCGSRDPERTGPVAPCGAVGPSVHPDYGAEEPPRGARYRP